MAVFAERLAQARAAAAAAGVEPPRTVPLFSSADLVAVKPALVVRTPASRQRAVMWCAIAFIGAFHVVSLVWWWRRVPGDRLLLAAVHLLTTIGFVVMLSRPDPLRDTLLIVRYTEGLVSASVCF